MKSGSADSHRCIGFFDFKRFVAGYESLCFTCRAVSLRTFPFKASRCYCRDKVPLNLIPTEKPT